MSQVKVDGLKSEVYDLREQTRVSPKNLEKEKPSKEKCKGLLT